VCACDNDCQASASNKHVLMIGNDDRDTGGIERNNPT
jgi:hypothetical protein